MAEKGKTPIKDTPVRNKQADEIITCDSCSIVYSKKDAAKHKIWCLATASGDVQNGTSILSQPIPRKASHGFVFKGKLLFGKIDRDIETPEEFQALPYTRQRDSMLFLNPASMKHLRLKIGDHIIVTWNLNDDEIKTSTALAWPSFKTALFFIGIPKESFCFKHLPSSGQNYVSITKIERPRHSTRIHIAHDHQSDQIIQNKEDFLRFAKAYLHGTCLRFPEDVIRIPYFGQTYVIRTISAADSGVFLEQDVKSKCSLSEQLSSLDITESTSYAVEFSSTASPMTKIVSGNTTPSSTPTNNSCLYVPVIEHQEYLLIDDSTIFTWEDVDNSDIR